jgi:hypothetical protein
MDYGNNQEMGFEPNACRYSKEAVEHHPYGRNAEKDFPK